MTPVSEAGPAGGVQAAQRYLLGAGEVARDQHEGAFVPVNCQRGHAVPGWPRRPPRPR